MHAVLKSFHYVTSFQMLYSNFGMQCLRLRLRLQVVVNGK